MYLKSLELSGFKSFGKKSELFFNTPISAIVGPNGSGKSNIAEAFRFVLGEQSIKSMRGKKGEDLIFNGSNDSARANKASVKITFDNSKRFLNVDFDEVYIERAVYRDGINEYLLNGTQVRLKDIIEILAGAHIGSSGHHIISQGEADRILNASIKERKAMIEDALGLKIYQYKREESERKLEKTEENIKSVESLRREILPHIKFLKKQVEKVEKALETKEKLKTLYREYFKREQDYIRSEKEKIKNESEPLTASHKKLQAELEKAKEILASSQTYDKKSSALISLDNNIRATREKKDSLSREVGRTEGAIASEERILKKQKELQSDTGRTIAFAEVESLTQTIEEKIKESEKSNDVGAIKSILLSLKESLKAFIQRNKTEKDSSFQETEKEIEKLKTQKKDLEQEIVKIVKEEASLASEYSRLQKEIEKEKDTNRDAEKKVFEIMATQNELISKINIVKVKEEKVSIEETDFKRELGEAGVLIGREILDYEQFEIQTTDTDRHAQEERRREIEKIKIRLEDSGIGASDEIMKEYREVSERDTFLLKELEDLEKSAASLKELIKELEEKINIEFKSGIEKINKQFKEFFTLMFGGGDAALTVVKEKKKKKSDTDLSLLGEAEEDSMVPEEEGEEGIDIHVSLPKKKVKGLMMLSGGERALTSIALIFAVSQVNPPPFIILDETDAALDEANSKKYGDMITNLAKLSQLILITHNRETMSRAGILYGVTMMSGISKLLSIQFDEAVQVAK